MGKLPYTTEQVDKILKKAAELNIDNELNGDSTNPISNQAVTNELKKISENNSNIGVGNVILSDNTFVVGNSNYVGQKGYYFKAVDITNKKIYLSSAQVLPVISTTNYTDTTFETPEYTIGSGISLVNDSKYDYNSRCFATITNITNNVITYSGELGFTSIVDVGVPKVDDYTLCVPAQPDKGIVSVREGSQAFGDRTFSNGSYSHTEGRQTHAAGNYSHAEGRGTYANYGAHAEGQSTKAYGDLSHAEGEGTTASGKDSHAEGFGTKASAYTAHAEGINTEAIKQASHAEGDNTTASGITSHAEGINTTAQGAFSHAEGNGTTASGNVSHSEGENTIASKKCAHSEGNTTTASGECTHSEGKETTASGNCSHAEGKGTTASGESSHAEGQNTQAKGHGSHAEGFGDSLGTVTATGYGAHAEGVRTTAEGDGSHVEGHTNKALGCGAHAEGQLCTASKQSAHAEGYNTKASSNYQHTQGKFNIEDTENKYAHIVGNGTSEAKRSNAHTLDWDGNAWYSGDVVADDISLQETEAKHSAHVNNYANPHKISASQIGAYTQTETDERLSTKADVEHAHRVSGNEIIFSGADLIGGNGISILAGSVGNISTDENDNAVIHLTNSSVNARITINPICEIIDNDKIFLEINCYHCTIDYSTITEEGGTEEDGFNSDVSLVCETVYDSGELARVLITDSMEDSYIKIVYTKIIGDGFISAEDRTKITNAVTKNDYATAYTGGVVKVYEGYGLKMGSTGNITTTSATEAEIDAGTHDYNVITPRNLKYAVKSVGDGYYATEDAVFETGSFGWTDFEYTADEDAYADIGEDYISAASSYPITVHCKGKVIGFTASCNGMYYKLTVNGKNVLENTSWNAVSQTYTLPPTLMTEDIVVELSASQIDFTDMTIQSIKGVSELEERVDKLEENGDGVENVVRHIPTKTIKVESDILPNVTVTLGAGWSGNLTDGFIHTAGNTEPLVFNIGAMDGEAYIIGQDFNNPDEGEIHYQIGNSFATDPYQGVGYKYWGVKCVGDNGSLSIIPTSTFSGTITNLVCKKITEDGTESIEIPFNFIGLEVPEDKISGFYDMGLGVNTLTKSVNTTRNLAIGSQALKELVTGGRNIGLGTFALADLEYGENNISVGADSCFEIKQAKDCIAIGKAAMCYGTKREYDIAIGVRALYGANANNAETFKNNIGIGKDAGCYNASSGCVFIGANAGYRTNNYQNTFIGYDAGRDVTTGSRNTCIGAGSKCSPTISRSTAIGYQAEATKSLQTVIGGSYTTETLVFGNLVVQGTDGVKRQAIFNEDGIISWVTVDDAGNIINNTYNNKLSEMVITIENLTTRIEQLEAQLADVESQLAEI